MADDLNRRFGVELNNLVWDALVGGAPTAQSPMEERERLLYAAHASVYHWMATDTGTLANHVRGEHLISRAATAVGFPRVAMRHALRCLELCEEHEGQVEDWDLAFAHEAIARAAAALGDKADFDRHHARATELGADIEDSDDRAVFLEELAREPWFGFV